MHPAVPVPLPWQNQDLALFHGTLLAHATTIVSAGAQVAGRPHTDFGLGFYTTTQEHQARTWAWRRSLRYPGQFARRCAVRRTTRRPGGPGRTLVRTRGV